MTDRDLMEQAMGALRSVQDHRPNDETNNAIAALRERLAQPEQEPVAYVTGFSKGYAVVEPVDRSLLMCVGMALYRSPPQCKPLKDVEIINIGEEARAIERAHNIGGKE